MPERISCRLSESLPQCRDRCRHVHIVTRMGMYRSMPFLVNNGTLRLYCGTPGKWQPVIRQETREK